MCQFVVSLLRAADVKSSESNTSESKEEQNNGADARGALLGGLALEMCLHLLHSPEGPVSKVLAQALAMVELSASPHALQVKLLLEEINKQVADKNVRPCLPLCRCAVRSGTLAGCILDVCCSELALL